MDLQGLELGNAVEKRLSRRLRQSQEIGIGSKAESRRKFMEEKKKFTGIQKLTDNPFLNLYHMDALANSGKSFHYYFVSRNQEKNLKIKTGELKPEGIVIYPIWREDPEKIVMIRQYRYPVGDYLYELPAGLVDPGETPEEAAVREMKEETGLDFTVYQGGKDMYRRPFFFGPGFTDETGGAVFGYASGKIDGKYQEDSEDIEVFLADREMAERILETERVSLRCAYLLMQFLHMEQGAPFAFLE